MPYIFDCSTCQTPCDGNTLGVYNFENDLEYSEHFEQEVINDIIGRGWFAKKTDITVRPQYPDIEVYDKEGGTLKCFIEIKAQRRTFMGVARKLPNSNLHPSETVALNQSDLEHYINQSRTETVPIYVAWVLSNRPCIVPNGRTQMYYNTINELERIFNTCGDSRRFRRRNGEGDVVNGQHRGVVVNYHFSLNELKPLNYDDILR